MRFGRSAFLAVAVSLSCALGLAGCTEDEGIGDPSLRGAWVDGEQTDFIKIYITEVRFDNGNFEWWWDGDLQQRGVYDTEDGVLSVTIEHNYASPQRLLGDLSRPYSIVGDTLTWGGWKLGKK